MRRETISKTIRIPRGLNESIGELSAENNISLNRFIVCSCVLALILTKMSILDMENFVKYGKDFDECCKISFGGIAIWRKEPANREYT